MTRESDDNNNTQSFVALTKGTKIGHYRIIEKIGAGGMGEVYLAEDTELNRKVAMKFLPAYLCQDEDCRLRFKREAQAAARLNHPNIVTIYEVGYYNEQPYIAMEYVKGQTLKERVEAGIVRLDRVIDGAIQVCNGLEAAHKAGVIHRDLKPSNILVDADGRARILDFGLAVVSTGVPITKTGTTLGTIGYMSPEQIAGHDIDERSDLFSAGVILYELFSGDSPFRKQTDAATFNAILHENPEPLKNRAPDVSDELESIIFKLLEKDPNLRYQSAAEVADDLKKITCDILPSPGSQARYLQPSIAVLPFANLSADPEQEYFCDGIAEEIINALTQVKGLHVVARTSCFSFKGKDSDIREIGNKLNVKSVLEGSVRKAGDQLRITAQLINVNDGFHVWSERFDRRMKDIFAIQDEIASAVVTKLRPELLTDYKGNVIKHQTEDIDAYRLYLRGLFHASKRVEKDILKSIELFEQAIERDPEFAPAYAALAYSYCILPDYSPFPQREASLRAKKAVLKALDIDGSLAEAHACLGMVKTYLDWDWQGADKAYRQAVAFNPASAMVRYQNGFHLMLLTRFDEAIAEIRCALELDPLSVVFHRSLGTAFLYAERFDEAIEITRRTIELDPAFPYAYLVLGAGLAGKARYEEAIAAFRREIEIGSVPDIHARAFIGLVYVEMKQHDKARSILDDLEHNYENPQIANIRLAELSFALGDIDRGFEFLEKAFEQNDPFIRMLKCTGFPNNVKSDARYSAMLKRMGMK